MTSIISCPHCKGSLSISVMAVKDRSFTISTAQELVSALMKDSRRDVYAYQGGSGYSISYQGGTVRPQAITDALNSGVIKEKYSDKKLECWILA